MFCVLEGNLFPPRLTWGIERSLSASIFDHVFDSVSIILFSGDSYAIYTKGLERSQLVSVLLSPASCVFGWGLERSLSAYLSDDSYVIYTKGLEMSQPVSVLLSPTLCVLAGVLKGVSVHVSLMTLMPSTPRVLK